MDKRVKSVIDLMNADLQQSLSVSYMAHLVNLSPTRFSHLFKEETGVPPLRYLRTLRMCGAAHLLLSSYLTVKEVMISVGFRDVSHFVRDFKRMYGVTPTEFRLKRLVAPNKKCTTLAGDHAIRQ